MWDGASGAGGASGSGGAGEENEVSSTADDAARETAPETEAQGEVESEAARETAGEAGEMAREATGEMAGEAAGAAAGEAEGEEETGHGAAEDGDDGEAARVPCAEESALHTERAQLHLNIGRLEESLKAFDVPAVNDAVLKDSNDIEYFDQIVALCGAAQRRHVQPTRRARVASAQFRAIRLACKRSAAAAAKSQTHLGPQIAFFYSPGFDCFLF